MTQFIRKTRVARALEHLLPSGQGSAALKQAILKRRIFTAESRTTRATRKEHLRSPLVMSAVAALMGCSGGTPSEVRTESQQGLQLKMEITAGTGVTGMHVEIAPVSCGDGTASRGGEPIVIDKPLDDLTISGGVAVPGNSLAEDSAHVFADTFVAVPAGCYEVKTTPSTTDDAICHPAREPQVVVTAGKTTEVFLLNQCDGSDPGAIDVLAVANHPPVLLDVRFATSKFVASCEEQSVCATARDPENDPIEFVWTRSGGPPIAGPMVKDETDNADGSITQCVRMVPQDAGRVDLTVTAYDLLHNGSGMQRIENWLAAQGSALESHTSLDFPFYATEGRKPVPEKCDDGIDNDCDATIDNPDKCIRPSLNVTILPNGTYTPGDIAESRPLNLRFAYNAQSPQPSWLLDAIEYQVFADDESKPFFADRVNVATSSLPGQIDVSPGVQLAPDSTKIRVKAKLTYSPSPVGPAETSAESVVTSAWPPGTLEEDIVFDRKRDGYVRRHILAAGRGLSATWLKEYEPCVDDRDLLPYSRTQKVGDHTRVYVPWIHQCQGAECGSSVAQGASVVYGGDENPLLRSGLAMAAFSLEHLGIGDSASLNYAMKLFEYIEQSEWRDPSTGELTGFFLRSRYPGNINQDVGREYFYASVDELSGMSLGLVYLQKALTKAVSSQTSGVDISNAVSVSGRLVELSRRLGSQLRNNFYLIVPLRKQGHTWVPIGLPVEFQKGWSGAYAFEWFFARGFASVTGNDYAVPDDAYDDLADFVNIGGNLHIDIPVVGDILEEAVQSATNFAASQLVQGLASMVPAKMRAVTSIQAIGIGMRYGGGNWSVPIPCAPDVDMKLPDWKRWNFAMLEHVFQLAYANGSSDDGDAKDVKREVSRLVNGVLNGGAETELNMPDFVKDIYSGALFAVTGVPVPTDLTCWICNCSPTVTIGGRGEDINRYDQYSAAIARFYNLPGPFYSGDSWQTYWDAIWRADSTPRFAPWLPMAERTDDSFDKSKLLLHNPDGQWGAEFCWEHGDCLAGAGGDGQLGLANATIKDAIDRGVDVFYEAGAMDWLLPYTLRRLAYMNNDPSLGEFLNRGLYSYPGPFLNSCTTNPVSLALAEIGRTRLTLDGPSPARQLWPFPPTPANSENRRFA